jgi:hypothetical protein
VKEKVAAGLPTAFFGASERRRLRATRTLGAGEGRRGSDNPVLWRRRASSQVRHRGSRGQAALRRALTPQSEALEEQGPALAANPCAAVAEVEAIIVDHP